MPQVVAGGWLEADLLAFALVRSILTRCVVKEPAMCYLVREHQAGAAEGSGATLPTSLDRLRPRWIGAVAAALVAGVAVAALVTPPSASPLSSTENSAPAAPLASRSAIVPTAAVVEQSKAPLDDGVPSASDVVKAGMGHCEHGL
jgi:hypothetical protein